MDPVIAADGTPLSWLRPGVARTLEGQVIPRLLALHRPHPPQAIPASAHLAPLPAPGPADGSSHAARPLQAFSEASVDVSSAAPHLTLVGAAAGVLNVDWAADLAVGADDAALLDATERLLMQGWSEEAVQLDWLGPAAAELGRRWERDDCSFSDVTIGLVRLQCAARRMGRRGPSRLTADAAPAAPRILLAAVAGEQHGFGLTLVADAFRRTGWDVAVAVAGVSPVQRVAREAFDLVGLSVGSQARAACVPALSDELRRASRRPGLGVLLGGPLFALPDAPVLATAWGVDAVSRDAREALANAAAWIQGRGGFLPGAPPGVRDAAGR
jgi:MerR family transcriptional regulator, light-induced transcriptional regulator